MTTTDPFNTAEDRFDESPHHLADYCEHAGVGKACRRCRRKFDAASQWARTHLAAQEPMALPDESEMEVVGEWLVVRNAQEPDYPAGPEYGPYPYSDAAPLVHLARVAGFPPEPQEPTDAECIAVLNAVTAAFGERPRSTEWASFAIQRCREAMVSARAARRDEEKR